MTTQLFRIGPGVSRPLLLVTKLGSFASSEVNLLTQGCGEGKCSVYCRAPSKESRQPVLKRHQLPDGFQRKGFKDKVREGSGAVCDQLVNILLIGSS